MFADFITIREAAALVGCHKDTLLKAVHSGAIPGWQPGANVMVKKQDLVNWFESKRIRPEPSNPLRDVVTRRRARGGAR